MPLDDHVANLLEEIIQEFPMHFCYWHNILGKIRTQFDLTPHMQSDLWPKITEASSSDLESIRSRRPANISVADWDMQIAFWSNPKNVAR
ncbi:hypothetical protein Tco_0207119, partial [Tanacetum coccineum]